MHQHRTGSEMHQHRTGSEMRQHRTDLYKQLLTTFIKNIRTLVIQSLLTEILHFLGDKKLIACSICWLFCEMKLNLLRSLNLVIMQKPIKVKKVKCILVQALRPWTGRTAHRGSRGIALPFLDHGTRRGEGSASHPSHSLPPGKTRYPLYRRLGGPQGWSGQLRKISPPPGFDPQTVQPITSRYTNYATQPQKPILAANMAPQQVKCY